jgi:hypothetical protein
MSDTERCSVARRCSAGGIECLQTDRACADRAREHGLEVMCDKPRDGETVFVYCPPVTETRDSGVVWILLLVAIAVAVVGGGIVYAVVRKR